MKFFFYFFILLVYSSCSDNNISLVVNSGQTQGTYYHIKYLSEDGIDYHSQIDSILLEIDSSLSLYKQFSLISKLNSGEQFRTDSLFDIVFF